jgi:hypothetical protein
MWLSSGILRRAINCEMIMYIFINNKPFSTKKNCSFDFLVCKYVLKCIASQNRTAVVFSVEAEAGEFMKIIFLCQKET